MGCVTIEVTSGEKAKVEANVFGCVSANGIDRGRDDRVDCLQPFWARATIETRVKLGELNDSILALVDHG